ncbi:MAG: hypothetical protein U0Z53_25410 [Blastocatellia bacterium]
MTVKPPTILWATVVTILLLFLIDSESFAWLGGKISGHMTAQYDRLRGHYEIRICDLADCTGANYTDNPEERDYHRLLQTKYGITYKLVCGSAQAQESAFWQNYYAGNASGYNSLSYPAIDRKFGKTFLLQVHKEAIQNILGSTPLPKQQRDNLETALRVDEMHIEELTKDERVR